MKFIVFFFAIMMCSCFPVKELKKKAKAERYIEKALALDPTLSLTKYDTIEVEYWYKDTILIKGGSASIDTIARKADTIKIKDPSTGATVKIVYYPLDTSGMYARIKAELFVPDRDTIIENGGTIKVPIQYEQIKKNIFERVKLFIFRSVRSVYFIVLILALIGLFLWFKNRKR